MNFLTKISDLLYRKQKALEIIAVFLFLSVVAFKFDSGKSKWLWTDYPFVAILLALATVLIAIIWVKIEKQKMQFLISEIKNSASEKSSTLENKLIDLSARQKEVFDLIIKGKSNKEITSELIIELSTLKTHINQIYKILGIKNRKEAQSFGKRMK